MRYYGIQFDPDSVTLGTHFSITVARETVLDERGLRFFDVERAIKPGALVCTMMRI